MMLICVCFFASFLIKDSVSDVEFDDHNVEDFFQGHTPMVDVIRNKSGSAWISGTCYDDDDNYLGCLSIVGGAYVTGQTINYHGWVYSGVASAETDGNAWIELDIPMFGEITKNEDVGLNHPQQNHSIWMSETSSEPLADALNGRSGGGYADLIVYDEDGNWIYFGFISCDVSLP